MRPQGAVQGKRLVLRHAMACASRSEAESAVADAGVHCSFLTVRPVSAVASGRTVGAHCRRSTDAMNPLDKGIALTRLGERGLTRSSESAAQAVRSSRRAGVLLLSAHEGTGLLLAPELGTMREARVFALAASRHVDRLQMPKDCSPRRERSGWVLRTALRGAGRVELDRIRRRSERLARRGELQQSEEHEEQAELEDEQSEAMASLARFVHRPRSLFHTHSRCIDLQGVRAFA